jgi:DNA-binding CsgD family transcriptional regulator
MITPRQKDVLALVQRGLNNNLIARQLKISESTVKLHMTALMKEYGVQNRNQLALFSLQGAVAHIPDDLEVKPFGWVQRSGNKVVGIVFSNKPPKDDWEPVYLKTKEIK